MVVFGDRGWIIYTPFVTAFVGRNSRMVDERLITRIFATQDDQGGSDARSPDSRLTLPTLGRSADCCTTRNQRLATIKVQGRPSEREREADWNLVGGWRWLRCLKIEIPSAETLLPNRTQCDRYQPATENMRKIQTGRLKEKKRSREQTKRQLKRNWFLLSYRKMNGRRRIP